MTQQTTEMMMEHQTGFLRAAMEGVYELGEKERDVVLKKTAKMCSDRILARSGASTDKGIDTFITEFMKAFPGRRTIQRVGDILLWQFIPPEAGQCVCPLVRNKFIEPNPKQCLCSTNWIRNLVEAATKKSAQVDLLESALTGAETCRFLVHLEPPIATAKAVGV